MAYSTSIVNLPLGGDSCQDQHDAYVVERARVSKLAAELGVAAATCHKLHGDYDSAVAKSVAVEQERTLCQKKHQNWSQMKASYDAYLAYKADCLKYLDGKKKYADLVATTTAANKKLQAAWETDYAKVKAENYSISMENASKSASYQSALTSWTRHNKLYLEYRNTISSMSQGVSMAWADAQKKNPEYFKKYNWTMRTSHCGVAMPCVTKAWKLARELKCNPVRGLGALPNATECQYYYYYPHCSDTCPTEVKAPGPEPVPPSITAFKAYPDKPTLKAIPTFEEYLKEKGIKPMPDDCDRVHVVENPGGAPTCNPDLVPLPIPQRPTCTPPQIPAMPVAPTCKPSSFGQVGALWLLLAAGGAGLYWFAKKK